jgi:predicted small lipoprotein YifL
MKNLFKLSVVAVVIATTFTACESKTTVTEVDTVKVDTAIKVDSGKVDTAVVTTTSKKDSVNN